MISNRLSRIAHELLDVVEAAHLAVDLLQDAGALAQAVDDVLLDEGELDGARQLLQLGQLRVRLGQQLLLVLLAPQGQERPRLVPRRRHPPRHLRLLVCQDCDAPLVLVQLVALDLEVEDRPVFWEGRGRGEEVSEGVGYKWMDRWM